MTSLSTGWSSFLVVMQSYSKPYLPIEDQVILLEKRGLIIDDYAKAKHYLSTVGYYRLSGYSHVFRQEDKEKVVLDHFKEGVRFGDIIDLYVFDKRLRLMLLDAIERIEVALRVEVALQLGKKNAWAHLDSHCFNPSFINPKHGSSASLFSDWQHKLQKTFVESREDFVQHFKVKYPQDDLPIWMATELWDFGMLSKCIDNLKDEYKAPIALRYGLQRFELLGSWLRTINIIRNICAHHGRLWNRGIVAKPKYPKPDHVLLLQPMVTQNVPANRVFAAMCIIRYFQRYISPNSTWNTRAINLAKTFPNSPYINKSMMGMPDVWQEWKLWQ